MSSNFQRDPNSGALITEKVSELQKRQNRAKTQQSYETRISNLEQEVKHLKNELKKLKRI